MQRNLGEIYQGQGAYDKAMVAYKKAIQLQPADTHTYSQLANVYARIGKIEEIPQLVESLKPHLGEGMDYIHLGDAYLAGRFDDEAIEAYKRAIALDARNENEFKEKLVRAYEQVGKPEFAAEVRVTLPNPRTDLRPLRHRPTQANLVGKPALSFALRHPDGKEVTLADFTGKVVILNFWATWCPPCVKEIPHFIALYEEYKAQGVEMVGISVDREGVDVVKSFVQGHQVNYPILMSDGKVLPAYGGILSIPTTFVIDKEGEIRKQYVGYRDKSVFEADIEALLAKE